MAATAYLCRTHRQYLPRDNINTQRENSMVSCTMLFRHLPCFIRKPEPAAGVPTSEPQLGKEPLVLALSVSLLEELLDRLLCFGTLGLIGNRI